MNIIKRFLPWVLIFFVGVIFPHAHDYYVIDGAHEDNSAIKIWYTVLGLLDDYDNCRCDGFEISLGDQGKHFDVQRGLNWWSYYFAFHTIGSSEKSSIVRVPRYKRSVIRFKTVCTMSPERGNFLINKYMKLQPDLQATCNKIKHDYLLQEVPVVGVYYQNPIMPDVQQSWDPLVLCDRVKQEITEIGDCKICLFTDVAGYAEIFREYFGDQCMQISYLQNNEATSGAQRGEHEILTLLLLSQCDLVIAPGSYQSNGVKMLNPQLKIIELEPIPYACQ